MTWRFDPDHPDLAHLLRWRQDGVVARPQLLALGATDNDIERLVRRRDLTAVHPGVYVNHTGTLARAQREWVAVLAAWPAALARESALPVTRSPVVHIAVDVRRTIRPLDRTTVHRTPHLDERVDWRAAPPRVLLEHALIDVMSSRIADDDIAGAFALLTEVAFTRLTWPDKILAALSQRERVVGRRTIEGLVADLRDGACSVLERGYLTRVERAHGLPPGDRQHRSTATGRASYQDVRYREYGVIVELDGPAHHGSASARDRDALRDLSELVTGDAVTARLTYGLVFRDKCRTAAWIGRLLHRRGWRGPLQRCPACLSSRSPGGIRQPSAS